ncbi:uncharacterized protein LOC122054921 [Zingiber officinale]|uniref:uncharacterized protein LOC122054921 n=1 Tax=Zingiber officinale TaxID=94328 RepID=UPI001C4B85EA|nr:uncharacterized protein LOC122054921 [Zingiber officinale]
MNKSLDEAKEIIENMAQNHHQWASERSSGSFTGNPIKALGKFNVDAVTLMFAKLDALTKKFDAMGGSTANVIACVCDTCGGKPDLNPVEHCNRIELRSGRTVGDPQTTTQKELDLEKEHSLLPPNQTQNRDGEETTKKKLIASQKDEEFSRFLKKIKEIYIEVPLIDVLHQMPKFAKFLKGILSNRRQKGDFETVALTENYSALLMANPPPKLQDPGSFSISCRIGPELVPRAFCDLGASVSLLPYSLCKKLGL